MKPQYTSDWFSQNIPSWTDVFKEFKDKEGIRFLEIGSYEGRSARWLLENILTHTTATITCIDPFLSNDDQHDQARLDRFTHNLSAWLPESGNGQVTLLKGLSQDVVPKLPVTPRTFDVVYIDGSHLARDTLRDAVLIWPLVKVGGLVVFDDYGAHIGDPALIPRLGIDGFINAYAAVLTVIRRAWQIIVVKQGE